MGPRPSTTGPAAACWPPTCTPRPAGPAALGPCPRAAAAAALHRRSGRRRAQPTRVFSVASASTVSTSTTCSRRSAGTSNRFPGCACSCCRRSPAGNRTSRRCASRSTASCRSSTRPRRNPRRARSTPGCCACNTCASRGGPAAVGRLALSVHTTGIESPASTGDARPAWRWITAGAQCSRHGACRSATALGRTAPVTGAVFLFRLSAAVSVMPSAARPNLGARQTWTAPVYCGLPPPFLPPPPLLSDMQMSM